MYDKLTPVLRRAFLADMRRRVERVKLRDLEDAIRANSAERLLRVLAIRPADMANTLEQVRQAYLLAGAAEAASIIVPTTRAEFEFDIRDTAAEQWLRQQSSQFVTRISNEARESVRVALEGGMRRGDNPRTTALDIAGRLDANGRRAGGVVRLTREQSAWVSNARDELRSGDPERMARYLQRKRRDARFDGVVRKAIAAGKPVSAADAARLTARYSDRLLQLRGENIARTETLQTLNAGRDAPYAQAVARGEIRPQSIEGTWRSAGDGRVRDSHRAMNGQKRGFNEPFTTPSGAQMLRPGDASLGAPVEEIVNCRCVKQNKVDFLGEAIARDRA